MKINSEVLLSSQISAKQQVIRLNQLSPRWLHKRCPEEQSLCQSWLTPYITWLVPIGTQGCNLFESVQQITEEG